MKVAAVQMDIKILEKEQNLERILENLNQAARAGAKLVVFPECALTGYCFTGLDEAMPMAEIVPGPSTATLAEATRKLDCTAIVGLLECEGERLYNAAAVIGPSGVLGSYHKAHLPCLGIDWCTIPGDGPLPVFATPFMAPAGLPACSCWSLSVTTRASCRAICQRLRWESGPRASGPW